jgi:hypothetical protein
MPYRTRMTRASSRSPIELTAAARFSTELDKAAWWHVHPDGTQAG